MKEEDNKISVEYGNENLREILEKFIMQAFIETINNE